MRSYSPRGGAGDSHEGTKASSGATLRLGPRHRRYSYRHSGDISRFVHGALTAEGVGPPFVAVCATTARYRARAPPSGRAVTVAVVA